MRLLIVFLIIALTALSCGKKTSSPSPYIFATNKIELKENNSFGLYEPRSVGGGGAMSGFSISPYSNIWLVGTDMGTVFKSYNQGQSWFPIDHQQIKFSNDLNNAVKPAFSPDGKTIYVSYGGFQLFISRDSGETFKEVSVDLKEEKIKYFRSHSLKENVMYFATENKLYKTEDFGKNWSVIFKSEKELRGTFIDYQENGETLFQATENKIYKINGQENSAEEVFSVGNGEIKYITGGRDANGLTIAFLDRNGEEACKDIYKYKDEVGEENLNNHFKNCGYVWISKDGLNFKQTNQIGGDHLAMSENDSHAIYVTGSKNWIRQYGTKIWKSINGGGSFTLNLHQYNWDTGVFTAWDKNKLERSAVALDIGWDDSGYESFDVNLRNSTEVGGTGFYFLYASVNGGENWKAPFTKYADKGNPDVQKKWKSTGLEVTSVYKVRINPANSKKVFAAMADISGMRSNDGGETFKINKIGYNSIYDYAFDTHNENVVFAAVGSQHDFPNDGWNSPIVAEGGVYFSENSGEDWKRLTSDKGVFNRQFLSVAFDSKRKILYAGTQGGGIASSIDMGKTWKYINSGLPIGDKIIPQIEINNDNGDIYILLTGNIYNDNKGKDFSNKKQTGIYRLGFGTNQFVLLRGKINVPSEIENKNEFDPWLFPTSFAIDFKTGDMYLSDYEERGLYLHSGVWKSTDGGKSWNRKLQFTHPLNITIDPNDSQKIFVAGFYSVDGQWGNGGLLQSKNGGDTWTKNEAVPFKSNAMSVTLDPNDNSKLFYSFFGSAILHGPRPI